MEYMNDSDSSQNNQRNLKANNIHGNRISLKLKMAVE